MGFETKEQVRRLLKKVIELEDTVEGIRQRIAREASVSLKKAFEAIDVQDRGFVTDTEIKGAFDLALRRLPISQI